MIEMLHTSMQLNLTIFRLRKLEDIISCVNLGLIDLSLYVRKKDQRLGMTMESDHLIQIVEFIVRELARILRIEHCILWKILLFDLLELVTTDDEMIRNLFQ